MADQQNISQILAALAAQRPGGTPGQASGSPPLGQPPTHAFPVTYPTTTPPANIAGYPLPPPDSTGSLDISGPKPIPTGSGGIAEAISKARGIAAEKGIVHDPSRASQQRGPDPRRDPRAYHRSRSPSRTPPRIARETYRDNYNPYRDERRGERHGGNDRGYTRERSFSPRPAGRGGSGYSPPPSRRHWGGERSPPGRRGGGGSGSLDDNQETMNVEANLVGLIIGRSGDNLRRIESDTGTRIQFLDTDPTRSLRLCKITGNKAARNDAKDEIGRMITEHRRMGGSGAPLERAPRPQHHSAREEDAHTHIMVPDRTVGLIIGRGGETIRDLQERSGCHVSIVAENKSVNGLRPVNLAGSSESVARAKDMLLEIVDSDSRQTANPSQRESRGGYPPGGDHGVSSGERVTDSLMIPPDAVGMIIGKGGDTIKDIQSYTGCKINIQPAARRDADREVTMTGPRDAIEQARQIILEKLESEEYRSRPPRREEPSYGERHPKSQHQPYYQDSNTPSAQLQPQATQGAGAENGADPYAMYGGYQNYIAMCYAYMAQQQQQPGGQGPPGQNEASKPPGMP